ncbi:hypothetical protein KJ693_11505, partial [bacterium]|nr:hypothetical protein [bacterium]
MKWSAGQLVDTDSSGKAKYTWTVDGEHPIEAEAITTTAEGWVLIEIDTTTATIEAGKPTAMPGGPYRGGIKGGNFSPIQFNGNHPDFVEDEDIGHIDTWEWIFGQDRDTGTIWNPTCAFAQAGQYEVSLKVRSEYGKWSYPKEAQVEVIDGKVAGYVRAADLRTPVKEVRLTLTSSHVNKDVLAQIAASDEKLNTTGDGGLWTLTDDKGYYEFAHLPLGSYRIRASKGTGDNAHEFETGIIATELTLDGPNQLAIDFVDISVYPVGGRVVYSIRKNGQDVLVEGVKIKAQPVGAPSLIEALPSTKSLSATGVNYSMPLFAGKYFFLAEKSDHDIRIKEDVPNYDPNIQLVTIEDARTDIDFIDYTTYKLTVFVEDSGKYKIAGQEVIISGDNGQAQGLSDEADGKFAVTLNPGKYTVHVQGADPEEKEVDLTGGDNSVTLTIPVKIELSISPRPKLFDVPDEFLEQFGLDPEDNPEGYMYYYPPEPRTHTYTVTATANGNPVTDFNLFVTDEVGMLTEDAPGEQELFVSGDEGEYIMTAGLPKKTTDDPPLAAPKKIKFRAEKKGYKESDPVSDTVTVLGEVAEGSAAKIVAVPIMNYLVLHDPPGDKSYSYLDDSMTIKGIITNVNIKIDGDKEIPVYPSPWIDSIKTSGGLDPNYPDLKDNGLIGYKNSDPTFGYFLAGAAIEAVSGSAMLVNGALAWAIRLAKLGVLAAKYATGGQAIPGIHFVQYEISPNRHLETPSGDALPDILGPGKGDIYYGEGWTLGLQTKHLMGIEFDTATQAWNLTTETIETYDILDRTNQYIYTIRDIENIISDLSKVVADLEENLTKEENTNGTGTAEYKKMTQEKEKLENSKTTWQKLLNENLAYIWNRDYLLQGKSFEDFKKEKGGNLDDNETLIFSAGPAFEYSRDISAIDLSKYSIDLLLNSKTYVKNETTIKTGFEMFGSGVTIKFDLGAEMSLDSSHHYGSEFESGQIAEQSAGFVLQDDDVGDNFACWVYEDPQWKTPIFFQDAGSISSDPWEPGTNKAVDFTMELLEEPTGTFDYHQGANYKVKLTYTGQRELESAGTVDFLMYDYLADEQDNPTVRFNGDPALYRVKL